MVDLGIDARAALAKKIVAMRKTAGELQNSLVVDAKGYGGYSYPSARHWAAVLEEDYLQVKTLMNGGEVGDGMFGEEE